MDGLLRCDACNHGAISHDGSGCEIARCPCKATREDLVAIGLEAAREEIRTAWDRPTLAGSPRPSAGL